MSIKTLNDKLTTLSVLTDLEIEWANWMEGRLTHQQRDTMAIIKKRLLTHLRDGFQQHSEQVELLKQENQKFQGLSESTDSIFDDFDHDLPF